MKRKIFLFITLAAIHMVASAQYTTVVTERIESCFPVTPKNSIVRNWTGHDYAVTYSLGPTGAGVFCAIKYDDYLSGTAMPLFPVNTVSLPTSFLTGISDFRIIGDFVCFCGNKTSIFPPPYTSEGVLGFFDISDLISGSTVNYRLILVDSACFEKIEGFRDSYGFKVFALGYHLKSTASGINEHYAVFEVDNPPMATACTVQYSTIPLQQPGNEFFDDIVILRDRVVFVCAHHPLPPAPYMGPIEMRWVSKALGILDPQIHTRYYQTSTGPMPEYELNSRLHAKPIDDERFVVGYTYTRRPDGGSTRRLRVFDGNLKNIISQEYPIYSKLGMYEMVYNKGIKTLTVLEPDGITSRFVFSHPLNTFPYAALTLQDANNSHLFLDTISYNQIVSTQTERWTFQVVDQISYNPDVFTNNCIDNGVLEVAIIPYLKIEPNYDPLNYVLHTGVGTDSNSVITCTIKTFCISE